MNVEQTTPNNFVPFYPHSVNILTAPTNSGKTTFLIDTLKHFTTYYTGPVEGALIVLCNPVVNGDCYKELESEHFCVDIDYIENFEATNLKENFVLIFEDVSVLSPIILDCCNVRSHHLNLATIFVIVQSVLDNSFKTLLPLAQNLIYSFSGVNGIRLTKYIKKYYFASDEVKHYLSSITKNTAKFDSFLLLNLNQIARTDRPNYFAILGVNNMHKQILDSPTLVFPQLNKDMAYRSAYDDNETETTLDPSTLPPNAYLLVPIQNVKKRSQQPKQESSKEEKWNTLNNMLKQEIQLNMRGRKIPAALAIVSKMLRYSDFSFSDDGTQVMIKKHKKTAVPIIDFLEVATRPMIPNEKPDPLFCIYVDTLMRRGAPRSIIKNKSLFAHFKPDDVNKLKFGKRNKKHKH